ncbi:MAG: GTP-binding protein [Burkholderiaceae bacterium]
MAEPNLADPISVLTGFLGSGKTTLLRRLLAHPSMADTAVVINEFGEVGLDHLLVREITEDIVLLNSGCVCCTVRDDLVQSLLELQTERDAGRIPRFRRVAIESTGLADPAPIIHTLMTNVELMPHYRLGSVITTVDATLGAGQLDQHTEAVKQAAMADRLVITKSDLAPQGHAALAQRLRALNPGASILSATLHDGPGPDQLLDSGPLDTRAKSADVARWLNAEAYTPPASLHSAGAAGHPHHHAVDERHDARIASFCLTLDRPLAWPVFVEWLELLLASRGENLLRVKGLINVAGRSRPLVIHGVQHVMYPPSELAAWPDGDARSRIVFITRDLPRVAVENSFRAVFGDALLVA